MKRRCGSCKQDKDTTEFNAHNGRKDGLQTNCKECNKAYAHAYYTAHLERTGWLCWPCGEYKPLIAFETIREGKGHYRTCRNCRAQKKLPKRRLRYKLEDQSRKKQRQQPCGVARFVLQDCRKSDRKKGRENDLTLDFVRVQLDGACLYCGDTSVRMSLDRIDNSKGHTLLNVNRACIRCNYARGNMPYEAWLCLIPGLHEARLKGLFGKWLGRTWVPRIILGG